eukprot:gene5765-9018_t
MDSKHSQWFATFIAVLVLILQQGCAVQNSNHRPIVGVLTVPLMSEAECVTVAARNSFDASSCFTAFYVKWLESSGLRVAALPYNLDPATMAKAISSVSGVLFTGGGESLKPNTPYYKAASHIFKQVLEINDQGIPLPLWGTCMGFQLLTLLVAEDQSVLDRYAFDSENISLPLNFTEQGTTSKFVQSMPSHISALFASNITSNLHHDGITPDKYTSNQNLRNFYRLISVSYDRDGKAFGSTLESKEYPITATQWHPERPQFEWRIGKGINHTIDTISAMQWTGRYFATLAHLCNQSFSDEHLEKKLIIYTHAATLDPAGGSYQYYLFP